MKLLPAALAAFAILTATPAMARPLQCVPYARAHSDIDLHGNAATWWAKAQGLYGRGNTPVAGSVLVFKATGAMPLGHVAVVDRIVDGRHVILNHANWSRPGLIETSAMAEDVSADGDWSSVRVWYAGSRSLGVRENPTFGFIYGPQEQVADETATHDQFDAAFSALPSAG
ncbi:CHAP domain-containing protein [Novosphingobium beihaiensis]|uniref:CHAP domain-containing protein n=1 Tax=Novosphingobium beihaiensis TaxID=2930389 RepID=A0ABT0BQK4_9SPHN|nr:CHAP domain-containing protein [Novosphingobium beihaiensis]MCJ2186959.1 CHAP domain-containing protein [Novosphingobium beihaiensis]